MCSGGGGYSAVIDTEALVRYHALMEREKRDKLCARGRRARKEKARPVNAAARRRMP